uniref:Carboxypeptidase regulatory-like domain-containing protein n=1 Tax=Ignisphaera aggregans TaxID=334771 RepID=A0A7C2ZNF6_9CREN
MKFPRPKPSTSLALLILLMATLLIISSSLSVHAKFIGPSDRVYGYRIDFSSIGLTPLYVRVLNSSRIAVVGALNNTYSVAVVDVSNPYEDPRIEDLYPLTGAPTYVATDGYPITRMVVGSDKGEILLFRVAGGRLTKHLYAVLGVDFYVDKVYLARDSTGKTKIIALVVEGGSRGIPCLNCYVYVLDEDAQGILRIGPRVGNATALGEDLENIYVQDVAPLTVYDVGSVYWDASNVIITYIPQLIKLVFNVTFSDPKTGELVPLPEVLVEVRLSVGSEPPVVYGVNTDDGGTARVPIPLSVLSDIAVVNITIRDSQGNTVYKYTYTLDPEYAKKLIEFTDEIPLPDAVVSTKDLDTRPASKVYGIPSFLFVRLELFDFTQAPMGCSRKGSADFLLTPTSVDVKFLKGRVETYSKIVYYDMPSGTVNIVVASVSSKGIVRELLVEDYVGTGTRIASTATFVNGRYVLVGLSDGRIRKYVSEGASYRLKHVYPMGSRLLDIASIPGATGYTYVAIASGGVQVFRIEPYLAPLFRAQTKLCASVPGFVGGDVLRDPGLSTLALADPSGVTIVKNVGKAVEDLAIAPLEPFLARDVEITIVPPGTENVNGTLAVFEYPTGYREYVLEGSTITLKNIIPGIVYALNIAPPQPYIYPARLVFKLVNSSTVEILGVEKSVASTSGCCKIYVSMIYKEFNLRLDVVDEIAGPSLVAPVDVYIDGKSVATSTLQNTFTLRLLYGEHNITIVPSKGYEGSYQPYRATVYLDADRVVNIELKRVWYNVRLIVIDSVTGSAPIAPLQIKVGGSVFTVYPDRNVLDIVLPFGNYTVEVSPPPNYENVYEVERLFISIPKTTAYTISLKRHTYTVTLVLRDPYTAKLIAPINIFVNGSPAITNTLDQEQQLRLPYGRWLITLAPAEGYEAVYSTSETLIGVDKNTSIELEVPRVMHFVEINVVDSYGRLIAPVNLTLSGPTSFSQRIDPPGRAVFLSLPYGSYNISIAPFNTTIYMPYTGKLVVDSPQSIRLTVERVKYKLRLVLNDMFGLIGKFELYVNESKVADNVGRSYSIELPYGTYIIRVSPMPSWDAAYNPSKPITVVLTSDVNQTIYVNRKMYRLRVTVLEGTSPVSNAAVEIYQQETGLFITMLSTDERGVVETNVPYGLYKLVITHPSYKPAEIRDIPISNDLSKVVYLEPTVTTLIFRYLPIVGVLVGIGIAVYALLKIRTIIARRLAVEEELF